MARKFPNSVGMAPVSWLEYSHICCMFTNWPSVVGIGPFNELKVMERDSNVVISPTAAGIDPDKPGLVSIQCSLIAGIPVMYDRSPEMNESDRYKNSRFGRVAKTAGTVVLKALPSKSMKFMRSRPSKLASVNPPV